MGRILNIIVVFLCCRGSLKLSRTRRTLSDSKLNSREGDVSDLVNVRLYFMASTYAQFD